MDAALVSTWTHTKAGREGQALALAAEVNEFWEKKATDGHSLELQWFLSNSAPVHFTMVRGEFAYMQQLLDDDEYQRIAAKASLLLEGFHYYLYRTDSGAQRIIEHFGTAASELGVL